MKNLLENSLAKKILSEDIVSIHRITSSNSPRPVIVGFASHDIKMDVIKRRKALKGTGTVVAEDLCSELQQTMNRLKTDPRIQQTWAWDSKIYAKKEDGKIAQIKWGDSVEEAFAKV